MGYLQFDASLGACLIPEWYLFQTTYAGILPTCNPWPDRRSEGLYMTGLMCAAHLVFFYDLTAKTQRTAGCCGVKQTHCGCLQV